MSGARRFNERYNPGVPPSQSMMVADGDCLSAMDLLMATLGAGQWSAGSNTNEAGLVTLLKSLISAAEQSAMSAVALANKGARLYAQFLAS